ncbi:MAG: hypothetical protein JSU86_06165 [Phycisphaerales bacterium]|nr:MAG: hypothetical protein JSU86_06165 [Phycisphaerales bacterium]
MITRRFDVSLSAAINRLSDIQPRITDSQRLLPEELGERLLQPAKPGGELDLITIVDGVPKRRDLFSLAKQKGGS